MSGSRFRLKNTPGLHNYTREGVNSVALMILSVEVNGGEKCTEGGLNAEEEEGFFWEYCVICLYCNITFYSRMLFTHSYCFPQMHLWS